MIKYEYTERLGKRQMMTWPKIAIDIFSLNNAVTPTRLMTLVGVDIMNSSRGRVYRLDMAGKNPSTHLLVDYSVLSAVGEHLVNSLFQACLEFLDTASQHMQFSTLQGIDTSPLLVCVLNFGFSTVLVRLRPPLHHTPD